MKKKVKFNEKTQICIIEYYDRKPIEYLNRIHFLRRISNLQIVLDPILQVLHRKKIFQHRFSNG